jgi:hypothetical protein
MLFKGLCIHVSLIYSEGKSDSFECATVHSHTEGNAGTLGAFMQLNIDGQGRGRSITNHSVVDS